jgi:hypothetical protein
VRPVYAGLSLVLVAGIVLSQVAGRGRLGRRKGAMMAAILAAGAALLLFALPSHAKHLPLVDHDKFNGGKINADKWNPYQIDRTPFQFDLARRVPAFEQERRIVGGRVLVSVRVPKGFHLTNDLAFPYEQADQIETVQATVRALRMTGGQLPRGGYLDISDGPRAGLWGFFYNDGRRGLGNPSSMIGDVRAFLNIASHPEGGLVVFAVINVCDNLDCSVFRACFGTGPLASGGGTPSLGRIRPGQATTLSIDWDGTRFRFRRDARAPIDYTPPTVGDASSTACFRPTPTPTPNTKFKGLATRGFMPNPSTPTGAEAVAIALFDDVAIYLNPAYPSGGYFGASLLGPVRPMFAWASLALVGGIVLTQVARWPGRVASRLARRRDERQPRG